MLEKGYQRLKPLLLYLTYFCMVCGINLIYGITTISIQFRIKIFFRFYSIILNRKWVNDKKKCIGILITDLFSQ